MTKSKIWSGRFSQQTASLMEEFSSSISFDKKLFDADIAVNKAWADALTDVGIYTEEEVVKVRKVLDSIQSDYHAGKLNFLTTDEDIHTANERWLTERLGDLGARIHTGRSRNDQVVTDLRIYLRSQIDELMDVLKSLQNVLVNLAQDHITTILPGQTHLRQAQPISFAHYLLSFFFQLQRDKERFLDAKKRMNKLPLGSGAIAGAAFEIDRFRLAESLGFETPTENSYDATSDRDFVLEVLYICAQLMLHLSRIAEDLIIWSSEPFRFIDIHEKYATGSSMMPQKKNPDSLELIRGKTARVIGNHVAGLTLMKGIPTAYVRDLQEDKEPVFDSLEQTKNSIEILTGVYESFTINAHQMQNAIDPALYATDLADYLVRKGLPFRTAHSIVGSIVASAEKKKLSLRDIGLEEFKNFSPLFEPDVYQLFDPLESINKRNIFGGTGPKSILLQLESAKRYI